MTRAAPSTRHGALMNRPMRNLSTSQGDVLEAIRGLEREANAFRHRAEAAPSAEERLVLAHKAEKLEETAAYLRARLP